MDFSMFLMVLMLSMTPIECITNYIVNGDFASRNLNSSYGFQVVNNWTGTNFIHEGRYTMGFGQYLNMQQFNTANGYISQNLILPKQAQYDLTFYWRCPDTVNYHTLLVFWNEIVVKTLLPRNTTQVLFENFTFIGKAGLNKIMFMELSGLFVSGFDIDEIILTQSYVPPVPQIQVQIQSLLTQQQSIALSMAISSPINKIIALKPFFIFLDDLWLYFYDNRTYSESLDRVLYTFTQIQIVKFSFLESIFNIKPINKYIGLSNYTNYSTTEFVKIEDASSVFLDSNFSFLIYTIPQNIILGLILYWIFKSMKNNHSSRSIRKYFFFFPSLLQVLIESNVAYFVFVCFSHLLSSFCFKYRDKCSLIFTILFLFGLVIYTSTFFILVDKFFKKNSYHFIPGFYRINKSFYYLTLACSLRNFIKGAICAVFHYVYSLQILLLLCNQLVSLFLTIKFHISYKIFIFNTQFCLATLYRLLFVVLNLVLYLDFNTSSYESGVEFILEQIQKIILYLFVCIILLQIFCEMTLTKRKRMNKRTNTSGIKQKSWGNFKNGKKLQHKFPKKKIFDVALEQKNTQRIVLQKQSDLEYRLQKYMKNQKKNRNGITSTFTQFLSC